MQALHSQQTRCIDNPWMNHHSTCPAYKTNATFSHQFSLCSKANNRSNTNRKSESLCYYNTYFLLVVLVCFICDYLFSFCHRSGGSYRTDHHDRLMPLCCFLMHSHKLQERLKSSSACLFDTKLLYMKSKWSVLKLWQSQNQTDLYDSGLKILALISFRCIWSEF